MDTALETILDINLKLTGRNISRTDKYWQRLHLAKEAGLHHVSARDFVATKEWLRTQHADWTSSGDDFWFVDPNLAFECKLKFG